MVSVGSFGLGDCFAARRRKEGEALDVVRVEVQVGCELRLLDSRVEVRKPRARTRTSRLEAAVKRWLVFAFTSQGIHLALSREMQFAKCLI